MALVCLCIVTMAAATPYRFSRISVEDGLSSNSVTSICQDRAGNMWFATNNGLCRYDGYEIRSYKHDSGNPGSLQSNIVNRVRADREGRIWACTANGLSLYDDDSDTFRRFSFEDVHSVEDLLQISDDAFLLTTRNFSLSFSLSSGNVRPVFAGEQPFRFYSSVEYDGGFIFSSLSHTLERMVPEADSLRVAGVPVLLERSASNLVMLDSTKCMVGLQIDGLVTVDMESGAVTVRRRGITISALSKDAEGNIWVGAPDHLEIIDSQTRTLTTLPQKGVRCLYCDRAGGMWVGTEYGGVYYWNGRQSQFTGLGEDIVTALAPGAGGEIWIGTRYDGLARYNTADGRLERIGGPENIRSLWVPSSGSPVYVGCNVAGLHLYYPESGRSFRLSRPSDVNAILPARGGKVWIGALVGVFLFDPASRTTKTVTLTPGRRIRVQAMAYDYDGRLWIGSKESLGFYEIDDDNNLRKASGDLFEDVVRVQCFHEGSDSLMWIGCADGLFRFDGKKMEVRQMVEAEPLRKLSISGIEEDSEGNLWVSTDNGLCKLNPHTYESRFYYPNDGLPCTQFNAGASFGDPSGRLWFGGIGGAVCFLPAAVQNNPYTQAPVITGLYLHNEEVCPGDDTGILSKVVSRTGRIKLRHFQNSIRLTFSCPDYQSGGKNTFAYRLDGFDPDWVETSGREAIYSNLKKGKYLFGLRVANSDGVWCPEATSLAIRVLPPWYRTLFAEICYILAALLVLFYFVREILRRNNMRNAEALEKMRVRYEEKMRHARVTTFLADKSRHPSPSEEEFLCRTLDIIESRMNHPQFSVENVASILGMTRANLHLRLKAITGQSPIEIITRMRMEKAMEMLLEGGTSILEIAESTGFKSPSYFSACFKKATGLSPKEYAGRFRHSD